VIELKDEFRSLRSDEGKRVVAAKVSHHWEVGKEEFESLNSFDLLLRMPEVEVR
jgi:hypothetical protein